MLATLLTCGVLAAVFFGLGYRSGSLSGEEKGFDLGVKSTLAPPVAPEPGPSPAPDRLRWFRALCRRAGSDDRSWLEHP